MADPIAIYCDSDRVGDITEAFHSDDTWYANISVTLQPDTPRRARVMAFIELCIDWHKRIDTDPDASEFDPFDDIVNGATWQAEFSGGFRQASFDAPVFLPGGEITWRPAHDG